MGWTPDGSQAQPDIALVRRHNFQAGRLTDNCQIALRPVAGKVSGTQLHVLFVDEADKEDLSMRRPWARCGHVEQGLKVSADRPFGVARAAPIHAPIADNGLELQRVGRFTDCVEVRSQQDSMADWAPRG